MPTHTHKCMRMGVVATDWAGCDERRSCFFTLICLPGWAPFVFLLYKTKIADRWQPVCWRVPDNRPWLPDCPSGATGRLVCAVCGVCPVLCCRWCCRCSAVVSCCLLSALLACLCPASQADSDVVGDRLSCLLTGAGMVRLYGTAWSAGSPVWLR